MIYVASGNATSKDFESIVKKSDAMEILASEAPASLTEKIREDDNRAIKPEERDLSVKLEDDGLKNTGGLRLLKGGADDADRAFKSVALLRTDQDGDTRMLSRQPTTVLGKRQNSAPEQERQSEGPAILGQRESSGARK